MILVVSLLLLMSPVVATADLEKILAANHSGDTAALKELATQVDAESYDAAYLGWRLGALLFGDDIDEADAVLLRAQEILEKRTSADPDSAEDWALLSGTVGMRIGVSPASRAMKMGSASGRAGKRALKLEPDNPRVLLIIGINKFNTPAFFGGGKKKALKYFNKALSNWQKNGQGRLQWGLSDIHVWRGRTYQALRNEQAACADFSQALAVAPKFQWAAFMHKQLQCNPQ